VTAILEFFKENDRAIIALGVILSALVSVFGVLWASKASHRSVVAQMREKWIESLRSDIAELTTLLADSKIRNLIKKENHSKFEAENFAKTHNALNRIRLRLNKKEAEHQKLLTEIENMVYESGKENFGDSQRLVVELSTDVFRKEWKKAARGEV
jgi:hypothetical protein